MVKSKRNQEERKWLRENYYDDIADLIDSLIEKWKKAGKKTRRNWWEILAGGKDGKPRSIDGIEFPVLRIARARQGLDKVDSALARNRKERKQSPWKTNRWLTTK